MELLILQPSTFLPSFYIVDLNDKLHFQILIKSHNIK